MIVSLAGEDRPDRACGGSSRTPSTSCPTIYECLGVEPPEVVKGYTQYPIEGVSFAATFDDADAKTDKQTQFYSMGGTRAIWHQGWKAAAVSPSAPDMWAHYATQRWELFDTENDPTECHDLAAEHPDKLQELIGLWWTEAGRYQALPLENRNALEILTTERPQLSKPRNRYIYYPGGAESPNRSRRTSATAPTRSRSRSRSTPRRPVACCSPMARASAATRCTSRTASSSTSTTGSA